MDDAERRRRWGQSCLLGLVLALGTLVAYWPVRRFEFVNYDDPAYVFLNPMVQSGLSWRGFVWAFSNTSTGHWHPVTWLSHQLDCQLYGLNPGAHHLTSLLLHAVNGLLLFLLLKRMTGAAWRSAFTAALFAWHPLRVESVAWLSERKDVLSALFFLLTLWAYVRFAELKLHSPRSLTRRRLWYGCALLLFALGLMSKAMLITLPFVLVLLDYWPLGRFGSATERSEFRPLSALLLEKLPFFVLAVGSGMVALAAQKNVGALQSVAHVSPGLRLQNALVAYATYIGKTFWPSDLAVLYPYHHSFPFWQVGGTGLLLLALSGAVLWRRKSHPYAAVGWLWFLGTLVPVIGLFQAGAQAWADRYSYIPSIGLCIMVVWGLPALLAEAGRHRLPAGPSAASRSGGGARPGPVGEAPLICVGALTLACCLMLTRKQVCHWQNGVTLFTQAVNVTSNNYICLCDLGNALADQGDFAQAEARFREALRLRPDYAEARYFLGRLLAAEDRLDEAAAQLEQSLRLDPSRAVVSFRLAEVYLSQKEPGRAIPLLVQAIRLAPDRPVYLGQLAWIYATQPKAEFRNGTEAVRLAERACRLTRHRDGRLLATLGAAYAEVGRFDDAIRSAEEANTVAAAAQDTSTAQLVAQQLKLYRTGKPWRDLSSNR